MTAVVELLGPPAAGKSSLAAALADRLPVVPEQLRALLTGADPPPPGLGRQIACGRRLATAVGAAGAGPVVLDLGWTALVCYGFAVWGRWSASAAALAVAATVPRDCRYVGLVELSGDDRELRRRAAAEAAAPGGRHRGDLGPNLARARREADLLRVAEPALPAGFVLRPQATGSAGQAREVLAWLATRGAGLAGADLLRTLAAAWSAAPADGADGVGRSAEHGAEHGTAGTAHPTSGTTPPTTRPARTDGVRP